MGYFFFIGPVRCGNLLSWQVKMHPAVTLHTNHSEYVSSCKAAREAMHLKGIFTGLGLPHFVDPITIFGDNSGAIGLSYDPYNHEATKHIQIAWHYVRELVANGDIITAKVASEDNPADVLTKALVFLKFDGHVRSIMVFLPKKYLD